MKTKLCRNPRLQWNVPIWLKIFTTSRGDVTVLLKIPAKPTHSKLWELVSRSSFLTTAILHKKNDFLSSRWRKNNKGVKMNTNCFVYHTAIQLQLNVWFSSGQSHWWIFGGRRGVVCANASLVACKINPSCQKAIDGKKWHKQYRMSQTATNTVIVLSFFILGQCKSDKKWRMDGPYRLLLAVAIVRAVWTQIFEKTIN